MIVLMIIQNLQAALESGWNLKAKTVFGIKGTGFVATTSEYYNGVQTTIQDSFRQYADISASVVGYYDFLAKTSRYAKALNNTNYKDVVYRLINTLDGKPYATDPNYISKITKIIQQYNLTSWDDRESADTVHETEGSDIYTVKTGDNLSKIAAKYGTTYQALAAINGLSNPNLIHPGQILKISGSYSSTEEYITYTIQPGDTLSGIGAKYKVAWKKIAALNSIKSPYLIYPKQKIKIPK